MKSPHEAKATCLTLLEELYKEALKLTLDYPYHPNKNVLAANAAIEGFHNQVLMCRTESQQSRRHYPRWAIVAIIEFSERIIQAFPAECLDLVQLQKTNAELKRLEGH